MKKERRRQSERRVKVQAAADKAIIVIAFKYWSVKMRKGEEAVDM